jgi:hypothetical protein
MEEDSRGKGEQRRGRVYMKMKETWFSKCKTFRGCFQTANPDCGVVEKKEEWFNGRTSSYLYGFTPVAVISESRGAEKSVDKSVSKREQ